MSAADRDNARRLLVEAEKGLYALSTADAVEARVAMADVYARLHLADLTASGPSR